MKIYYKNSGKKILIHLTDKQLDFESIYAIVGELLDSKDEVNELLKRLTDEFYIKNENKNYSFISIVLRDWWKNFFEFEK